MCFSPVIASLHLSFSSQASSANISDDRSKEGSQSQQRSRLSISMPPTERGSVHSAAGDALVPMDATGLQAWTDANVAPLSRKASFNGLKVEEGKGNGRVVPLAGAAGGGSGGMAVEEMA